MADEVKVTILPPGKALGADDLQRWAQNRSRGGSGPWRSKGERKREAKAKSKRSLDAADRWLAKHQ